MILGRTVIVPDSLARANVVEALTGPGAPLGITSCSVDDSAITVTFEADRTAPELVDALIAIQTAFVPAATVEPLDLGASLGLAAAGLHEPELDSSRIIETYLA